MSGIFKDSAFFKRAIPCGYYPLRIFSGKGEKRLRNPRRTFFFKPALDGPGGQSGQNGQIYLPAKLSIGSIGAPRAIKRSFCTSDNSCIRNTLKRFIKFSSNLLLVKKNTSSKYVIQNDFTRLQDNLTQIYFLRTSSATIFQCAVVSVSAAVACLRRYCAGVSPQLRLKILIK